MQFGGNVKLSMDYVNAYLMIDFCRQLSRFEEMKPIQTYEEYFSGEGKNPNILPYVLKLSDAKAIEDLNKLVIDFNNDLNRIKEEKDMEAVKEFLDKIGNLMKEKK
ncbi:MAG TPA: hypothetical protein PKH95_03105 [Candidatus Magasanikbacteria bacterium]|nr:hypothetical protein [Candidatus Magasanikbacteria bacterium]